MFGIEFGAIEWGALSGVLLSSIGVIRKVLKAIRGGIKTTKEFTSEEIKIAKDEIKELKETLMNKYNYLDSQVKLYDQKLARIEQREEEKARKIRELLEDA